MPIKSQTFSKKGTQVSSYTFKLTVQEDSYDIATNSSRITCFASISSSNGYYFELHGIALTLKIDGVTKYSVAAKNNTVSIPVNASNYIIMSDKSYTIPHDNDGSKTISVSLLWDDTSNKGYTYMPGDTTISGNFTLTTIPRASSITCSSFDIASNPEIIISPQITGAKHTLTYSFGSGTDESGTIVTKSSDLTIPWDTTSLRSKMYQKIPNSNTLPVTFSCTTYNGDTPIGGTKSITVNAVVMNSNPTISNLALKDNVTTLTGTSDILVNNVAKPTLAGTVAAKNYATITNVEIVASDGQTASLGAITSIAHQFGIIKQSTAATEFSVTVKATDSRGNFSTTRITKLGDSYKNYSLPTITSFVADRNNATSTTIEYAATMSYWNKNFGSASNTPFITIQYSGDGGVNWSNAKTKQNVATLTGSVTGLSEDKDYLFRMVAFDKTTEIISTNTTTKTVTVGKSIPYIDMTELKMTVNVPLAAKDILLAASQYSFGEGFGQFSTLSGTDSAALDLNNYTRTGIYYFGTKLANAPSEWIKVLVLGQANHSNSFGDIIQVASKVNTDTHYWIRARNGATWYAWKSDLDFSHAIGSVITTSTNTNPSGQYGGTWTLIDKEFTPMVTSTVSNFFTSSNSTGVAMDVNRAGHTITISGYFDNSVALTDSTVAIGTFKPAGLGITGFASQYQRVTGFSDGANSVVYLQLTTGGVLQTCDINYSLTSIAKGQTWQFSLTLTIGNINQMVDSACNKFYWKRTA